jgi:hypothetical protein
MTSEMATTPWAMLLALGAFHGINPGMGWLFAVALGMQERRRGAVLRALVPLGAGHALAVAAAVGAALAIGAVIPLGGLRWLTAGVLVALGALRFSRHQHPRGVGMRVGMGGLTLWSFLMATAHGAGLMVVPVFVGMSMAGGGGHVHHMPAAAGTNAGTALLPTGLSGFGGRTDTVIDTGLGFLNRTEPLLGVGGGVLLHAGPVAVDLGYRYKQIMATGVASALNAGRQYRVNEVRFGVGFAF